MLEPVYDEPKPKRVEPMPVSQQPAARSAAFGGMLILSCFAIFMVIQAATEASRTAPLQLQVYSAGLPHYQIDPQTASAGEWLQLPRVGPKTAQKLQAQLASGTEINLGPKTTQQIQPFIKSSNIASKVSPNLLDLNHATEEELDRLPGIGKVLAQRIIEYRQQQPFESVEDLRKVSGFGAKRIEAIRSLVYVQNNHQVPQKVQ